MSADNYYLVRKHYPSGKFVALQGFSSDPGYPEVRPDREYLMFDDPRDALVWASQQPSEYGASLHPECGNFKVSKSEADPL